MQIYNWTRRPQEEFQDLQLQVLLFCLYCYIVLNSIAVFIRNKFQKRLLS